MRVRFKVASALFAGLLAILSGLAPARAGEPEPFRWIDVKPFRTGSFCGGNCAIHIYGGAASTTSMTSIFALDDVATFAPDKFVPFWDWKYTDSRLIAGAMSRKLVTFFGVIDVEAEMGIGKRFGGMTETELWTALYLRWTWFPWNDYLRTTIATSTGLNWASGIADEERLRDGHRRGSQLLHFFSPEITFALPAYPEVELVARLHHRSGAKILFGEVPMFNGVDGGAHFATLGIRYRF